MEAFFACPVCGTRLPFEVSISIEDLKVRTTDVTDVQAHVWTHDLQVSVGDLVDEPYQTGD